MVDLLLDLPLDGGNFRCQLLRGLGIDGDTIPAGPFEPFSVLAPTGYEFIGGLFGSSHGDTFLHLC